MHVNTETPNDELVDSITELRRKIRKLERELAEAQKAVTWISINERQPTMSFQNADGMYSQDVLVLLDNDIMRVCYYHNYRWELAGLERVQVENVEYWMELPINPPVPEGSKL